MLSGEELQAWTSVEPFVGFEGWRRILRPAHRKLCKRLFDSNLTPGCRILELGSGLGELADLVPEYAECIQQTDGSQTVVSEHRRRKPGSNIQLVNAYSLPYDDASFDAIVGYGFFDVIVGLPEVAAECSRVLKPGGKLLSILDLLANSIAVLERQRHPDYALLPYLEICAGAWINTGIQKIPKSEIRENIWRYGARFEPPLLHYLEQDEAIEHFWSHPKAHEALMEIGKLSLGVPFENYQRILFNDDFSAAFSQALESANFKVITNGYEVAQSEEKKSDESTPSYIWHRAGMQFQERKPKKGASNGCCLVDSELLVIVAEKKKKRR